MDEQQLLEVAEAAFNIQFAGVEIVRLNIRQRLGFEDDSPVVDMKIIYDGKYDQGNGRGFLREQSELSLRRGGGEGRPRLILPPLHRQIGHWAA